MAWPTNMASFYSWEEVCVSRDRGRREVHYYLKRRDGGADLAVIGKEKSLRHMSYKKILKNKRSVLFKLKSRRDVVDWLNSIVSDASPQQPNIPVGGSVVPQAAGGSNLETFKDAYFRSLLLCTKDSFWIGSPWTGRKKRKHYLSFCRNGVRVSVNDFVYVLAEEHRRLIAYLEDMYEDSKGYKMVVVRWFHKVDEVGIVLPHNVNDREIFFSLCLQDINIECIDGLATVLSPQHYEKLLKQPTHIQLNAFFCQKIFENDEVKPYDITRLRGYWKQELLSHLYNVPIANYDANALQSDTDMERGGTAESYSVGLRPKKKHRLSKNGLYHSVPVEILGASTTNDQRFGGKSDPDNLHLGVYAVHPPTEEAKQSSSEHVRKGMLVEVLSQDSGIRGCWFRALIMKRHKGRVKVQYQDIQDAENEAKKLEEWILASRVAVSDHLSLRIDGRAMIRPFPESCKGETQGPVDLGTIVDVWWHDGWWEGIVVQKESEDKFQVYFPGEKKISVFHLDDLRHSQEWLGNEWMHMKPRPDLVSSLLSFAETKQINVNLNGNSSAQVAVDEGGQSRKDEDGSINLHESGANKGTVLQPVPDLLKAVSFSKLKWKTSRKRRRASGRSVLRHALNDSVKSAPAVMAFGACERSLVAGSFKVDCDNCKYPGDSLFGSSMVAPLTSLVMSR